MAKTKKAFSAKRVLALALALIMALSVMPAAFAADIVDSGTCGAEGDGSNVTWLSLIHISEPTRPY